MNSRITFEEETHTYRLDGVKIPSVSALIKCEFPNTYANVDEYVLEKARQRGQNVHRLIEMYERFGLEDKESEVYPRFNKYLKLKQLFRFEVKEVEIVVFYEDGFYKYAGTIDIVGFINSLLMIADNKTFNRSLSNMTKDCEDYIKLQLQLSGYAIALEYMISKGYIKDLEGKLVEALKVIHLPNGKGKFLPVERNDKLFFEKLKQHYPEMLNAMK